MRVRLILPLAAALTALALTGCGSGGDNGADAEGALDGCTPSGSASEAVQVSGEPGTAPEAEFDTPVEAEGTQRTVLLEGDGDPAVEGGTVSAELTLFDGTTGDQLISTGHDGTQPVWVTLDESWPPGFVKALTCSTEGSRIVAVLSAEDAYGASGNEQLGIGADTPLVLVADVVSVPEPPLERADGEPQELPEGFPAVQVELDDEGRPTVSVPAAPAPADLQIGVLQQGEGAEVEDGDSVTVHYTGVDWETGEVFDESWPSGQPATFSTAQVVPGFSAALVGQQVGSQVLAVLPPDQAYGPEGAGHQLSGKTLVFVIDILATS